MARIYAVGVLVLVVAVLVAAAAGLGYRAGRAGSELERAEERIETSDALAQLARRYAAADAEAERARAAAQALAAKRVAEAQREATRVPLRPACGHDDAEYRVLLDAHCAHYPDAADCLHDPVHSVGSAGTGT